MWIRREVGSFDECSGEWVRTWAEVGVAQDTPAEAESHSGMWVGSLSAPQLKPWGKGSWYFGRDGKFLLQSDP